MKIKSVLFFIVYFISISNFFSQEKQIAAIKITGNLKTKTNFLHTLLETKKGDLLDSITLKNDITFLKRLPAISNATYKVIPKNNNYTVVIFVDENFTLLPTINFWTSANQQFSYKLGLHDYNFLGKNIAFGGYYQNNGFDSYGINFTAPNLFSKKWGLAMHHQNWKSEEPLYFNNTSANYLYNNISLETLALLHINLKNQLKFGVNFFNEKYSYLSGATDPSIPKNLNLNKTLFKLVYTFNNLQFNYQNINGFKSILYTQFVTSNNAYQEDFFIAWNDFFYFKTIGNKGNWANRLRFGLSTNQQTPFAPFALDNNVNLRGVGILVDRGTGSFVYNTEYRHAIYNKKWLAIQTNIFTDFGSWRNPGGSLNDFFKEENLRIFSGIGLRFISKKIYNATFRIDYGFKILDKQNTTAGGFVFGIGQYF